MFRLMLLLCATIFAVLLVGGRDHGQVRYGLMPGKMAPLVLAKSADAQLVDVAAAAGSGAEPVAAEAIVATKLTESAEPAAEAVPLVTTASFDLSEASEAQGGLTLSLPLVEPDAEPVVAVADAPTTAELEVQYVVGTSVNVRQGPSAETESLAKLARGEAVMVLPSDMPGWSKIRIEGDGVEGFIASRFLSGTPETSLFSSSD